MRLHMLAVGTRMPDWVKSGYEEYARRLPRECHLVLKEIPLAQRSKNTDLVRAIDKEATALLTAIPAGDRVVALDVQGRSIHTHQLAKTLAQWQQDGRDTSFLIGGPDGLSERCLAAAQETWSLSALTLPHPLVRILLAEQLYRAWSLLHNHPYHR